VTSVIEERKGGEKRKWMTRLLDPLYENASRVFVFFMQTVLNPHVGDNNTMQSTFCFRHGIWAPRVADTGCRPILVHLTTHTRRDYGRTTIYEVGWHRNSRMNKMDEQQRTMIFLLNASLIQTSVNLICDFSIMCYRHILETFSLL
jgi:hypothetical protein